jgi:CRISPR/Cas system CSM-associated protein Csm2 small subunit
MLGFACTTYSSETLEMIVKTINQKPITLLPQVERKHQNFSRPTLKKNFKNILKKLPKTSQNCQKFENFARS